MPDGTIKLGDYGISKVIAKAGEESLAAVKRNQINYTSPEQLTDNEFSEKGDIWALGCVVHEMCLMRKTFREDKKNPDKIKEQIKKGQVKSLPDFYSRKLDSLIKKMLHKDPSKRPSAW